MRRAASPALLLAVAFAACGPHRAAFDDGRGTKPAADARAASVAPAVDAAVAAVPSTDAAVALPADFSIALERKPCLGTCPAYTVTVDARGAVFFAAWYPTKGCASGTVDVGTVAALARRVDALGFFALKDRYTDPVTDHPWAYTTVTSAGRHKTVAHYQADRLDASDLAERQSLTELEEAIDDATRAVRAPLGPCGGKSPYPGVP